MHEEFFVPLLGCDDLFPVPLIDVNGMKVVELLIAPDGVHVCVQTSAGSYHVSAESHALPLGQ